MSDLSDWIGRTQSVKDIITQSGVDRFCATIGSEPNSEIAPLGFHWCLGLPDNSMQDLGEDGHPKKGGFLPPVQLPRRMWASSKVEFLHPLAIGETIERHSSIASVSEKSGKTGALVFVEVEHQTEISGQVAIRERQTIVYREASLEAAQLPEDNAEAARRECAEKWQVIEQLDPSTSLLFRYSALTFNSHRIHYDLPYAKSQELYPALIVHGPLMTTLALQMAAKQGDVTEFSFRALSPAYCDQSLFLTANFDQTKGELATIGGDGRTCLSAQAAFRV